MDLKTIKDQEFLIAAEEINVFLTDQISDCRRRLWNLQEQIDSLKDKITRLEGNTAEEWVVDSYKESLVELEQDRLRMAARRGHYKKLKATTIFGR